MCPLLFTRRASRRAPPISSNDHALEPIQIDQSINQSSPIHDTTLPHESSLDPTYRPTALHDQPGSFAASGAQGTSGTASDVLSGQIVSNPQSVAGDSSTPGPSIIQSSASAHKPLEEGTVEAHGPIQRPSRWFCHMCKNGPQGIETPSCTGMTQNGICGHIRCSYCRQE